MSGKKKNDILSPYHILFRSYTRTFSYRYKDFNVLYHFLMSICTRILYVPEKAGPNECCALLWILFSTRIVYLDVCIFICQNVGLVKHLWLWHHTLTSICDQLIGVNKPLQRKNTKIVVCLHEGSFSKIHFYSTKLVVIFRGPFFSGTCSIMSKMPIYYVSRLIGSLCRA